MGHWHPLVRLVITKEFISMIEGTAPAIVIQRCGSPNLSPLCLQCTLLPDCLTEQAGRGWVSHIYVRRWRVLSLQSLIYILWLYCNSLPQDGFGLIIKEEKRYAEHDLTTSKK